MMKKIMNLLMLSCKEATRLIDKKAMFQLSFKENAMLNKHTFFCRFCTAYDQQSAFLDNILHKVFKKGNSMQINNEELKHKIISRLNS